MKNNLEILRKAVERNATFTMRLDSFEFLARSGHAVNLDLILNSIGDIEYLRLHHSLTCTQCRKESKESTLEYLTRSCLEWQRRKGTRRWTPRIRNGMCLKHGVLSGPDAIFCPKCEQE